MPHKKSKYSPPTPVRVILLCLALLANAGCSDSKRWDSVWEEVQKQNAAPEPIPAEALQDGPPVVDGNTVLFRYQAASDVKKSTSPENSMPGR